MQIQIRLAKPADVDGMFFVRTAVTENILTMAQMADMGITQASVTEMLIISPCAWVAVEGDRVVGFSMIDPEEGSLFAAFVLPSHEGQGIGTRLVLSAEKTLFQNHATAWLETGKATRAAGFYRRLGWGNERDIGQGDIRLEKHRV